MVEDRVLSPCRYVLMTVSGEKGLLVRKIFTTHRGKWSVLTGSKRLIVLGSRKSNAVWFHEVEIKNMDVRAGYWERLIKAHTGSFYVEGERLLTTGKFQHSITLNDNLHVYEKPYRYP